MLGFQAKDIVEFILVSLHKILTVKLLTGFGGKFIHEYPQSFPVSLTA
jgi:hypothetical protein